MPGELVGARIQLAVGEGLLAHLDGDGVGTWGGLRLELAWMELSRGKSVVVSFHSTSSRWRSAWERRGRSPRQASCRSVSPCRSVHQ